MHFYRCASLIPNQAHNTLLAIFITYPDMRVCVSVYFFVCISSCMYENRMFLTRSLLYHVAKKSVDLDFAAVPNAALGVSKNQFM